MRVSSIIVGLLLVVGASGNVSAQRTVGANYAVVKAELDSEIARVISAQPGGSYLSKHCESFGRWAMLKALDQLGISNEQYAQMRLEARQKGLSGEPEPGTEYIDQGDLSNDPFDQDETTVAISRKDPRTIVIGSNDAFMFSRNMRVYVTTNAGESWDGTRLPKMKFAQYQHAGDPMVTTDADGRFYYTFLLAAINGTPTNLIVANSTNGVDWTYGDLLLPSGNNDGYADKETIAVDRDSASPHFGRVYVVWMHYSPTYSSDSSGLKLSFSDDHGSTWSPPKFIVRGDYAFSQLAVGKSGTVFVSFSDYVSGQGFTGWHNLLVSTDGSASFTQKKLAPYTDYPGNAAGWSSLKGLNGFRAFPYVSMAVDEVSNRIHTVYGTLDKTNGHGKLLSTYSDDLGTSWAKPQLVTTSTTNNGDCFSPTLAVDASTGETFVGFYASQTDTGNVNSTFVQGSLTGTGLGSLVQLDKAPFNPLQCELSGNIPFIGDYTGSDAFASTYAAAWTEVGSFDGDGEVFVYVASPQSGVSRRPVALNELRVEPLSVNPVGEARTELRYELSRADHVVIDLTDDRGAVLRVFEDGQALAGVHSIGLTFVGLPAGAYFVRIRTTTEVRALPVVHLH